MTLYRQIALSIVLLLSLGFIGTVYISTENLRSFLYEQLESHAQDTATSLGLSISPHMQSEDMPIINAMVDAIFDRGYYHSISLHDLDGNALVSRNRAVDAEGVPGWFIEATRIQAPEVEALVMAGWRQGGTVRVTSNPGNAYRELWTNTLDTLKLFLGASAVILVLALLSVRLLLRPLNRVEAQAAAISDGRFPVQKRLPRTRELRRVVIAMNRLAGKINTIFTEQSALTERLREQAYKDPVTGIGNRRYFNHQMQTLVEGREEATQGAFFLVELHNLAAINEHSGYTAGDQMLRRAADILGEQVSQRENCFVARLSGAGYGMVAVGLGRADAESLAETLCHELLQLKADGLTESEDIAHIGVAMWKQGDTLPGLLSEADIALRAAQASGQNDWQRYEPAAAEQADIHGSGHWQVFLQKVIDRGDISLAAQPVFGLGKESTGLLHREVLLRIHDDDGNTINAGVFMPMAERLGLASRIDRLAIGRLLDHLENGAVMDSRYAVNLASSSLHDPAFMQWLYSRLEKVPEIAAKLLFEFPEYGVLKNIRDTRHVIEKLASLGVKCGIDHFGRGFYSFGYLHSIKATYLKVDSSYTRNIENEEDNQFFMQALADTAHSIDIRVYAQAVETEAERNSLEALKLDGLQGYLTGSPETFL